MLLNKNEVFISSTSIQKNTLMTTLKILKPRKYNALGQLIKDDVLLNGTPVSMLGDMSCFYVKNNFKEAGKFGFSEENLKNMRCPLPFKYIKQNGEECLITNSWGKEIAVVKTEQEAISLLSYINK